MQDRVPASLRAAAFPVAGLALTYVIFALTPWGRQFDLLAMKGSRTAGFRVRHADLVLLEIMSSVTIALALLVLVLVAGARGRWQLGLRATIAVAGALATTEVLKFVLPSRQFWNGQWRWLSIGSFPSGHSVIVASLALAALSISSEPWRRIVAGPLAAWTAVATTATLTVGWHRPSDVIGSFFLATAWHRACTAWQPAERGSRSTMRWPARPRWLNAPAERLPVLSGLAWWALACLLVLGAAAAGILQGRSQWGWYDHAPARLPQAIYVFALGLLVIGAGLTVLPSMRPREVPSTSDDELVDRRTR